MKGSIFVIKKNKRSKGLTMQISQPSLFIFTKSADIFGHDCRCWKVQDVLEYGHIFDVLEL